MIHFNSKNTKENIKLTIDNIALPGRNKYQIPGSMVRQQIRLAYSSKQLIIKNKRNINLLRLGKTT